MNDHGIQTRFEQKLTSLVLRFIRSDLDGIGRVGVKILRFIWRDRPLRPESTQPESTPLPAGPFATTRTNHLGDILLWVPRKIDSVLVDDLTGGHGYSHTTIDTGEIDLPTRKPVMAEVTVGETVARKFQDQYGQRPFIRIPLKNTGVNVNQFVACVISKIGEPYDNWEAISLGRIQDPSKEVCSGLAADCMPENERSRIAWARRLGLLHPRSVSVHSRPNAEKTEEFVSPNGFAEYYGAPKGKTVTQPDVTVLPNIPNSSIRNLATAATRRHGWKFFLAAGASILFIYLVSSLSSMR